MQPLTAQFNKINRSEYRFKSLHSSTASRWFVLDCDQDLFYYKDSKDAKDFTGVINVAKIDDAVLIEPATPKDLVGFEVHANGAVHVAATVPLNAVPSMREVAQHWVDALNGASQAARARSEARPTSDAAPRPAPAHAATDSTAASSSQAQPTPSSTAQARAPGSCFAGLQRALSDRREEVKIVLVGNSGVGKTCLARGYVDNSLLNNWDEKMTIGVDFLTKKVQVNDTGVTLRIWDTAGQERFNALRRTYYRDTHIVMIVFDVSDKRSFLKCGDWLSETQEHCNMENVVVVLVGNKSDLSQKRQVTHDMATEFARSNNLEYIETSAFYGTNVDRLFQDALQSWTTNRPAPRVRGDVSLDEGRAHHTASCRC